MSQFAEVELIVEYEPVGHHLATGKAYHCAGGWHFRRSRIQIKLTAQILYACLSLAGYSQHNLQPNSYAGALRLLEMGKQLAASIGCASSPKQ